MNYGHENIWLNFGRFGLRLGIASPVGNDTDTLWRRYALYRVPSNFLVYRVAQKLAQFLYALTLTNINRLLQLFHCLNQEKICNVY